MKYIYLDIVGFTKDRSVEAQSDLVGILNDVVRRALATQRISSDSRILLPTGDGIAISIIASPVFDIHLSVAKEILRNVERHNVATKDPMRKFDVRIGINENVDNIVIDINGRINVAGYGISLAQRIMDKADAGQILIGQTVFETLRTREKYMDSFRAYSARGKHGLSFMVYQFVGDDVAGLDVSGPSAFVEAPSEPRKIPRFDDVTAHFVALAARNREFLASRSGDPSRDYIAIVLLYSLARDAVRRTERAPHYKPVTIFTELSDAPFEKQYEHYYKVKFWPMAWLSEFIAKEHLAEHRGLFDGWPFPLAAAIDKLCEEWPAVAEQFSLAKSQTEQQRKAPQTIATRKAKPRRLRKKARTRA